MVGLVLFASWVDSRVSGSVLGVDLADPKISISRYVVSSGGLEKQVLGGETSFGLTVRSVEFHAPYLAVILGDEVTPNGLVTGSAFELFRIEPHAAIPLFRRFYAGRCEMEWGGDSELTVTFEGIHLSVKNEYKGLAVVEQPIDPSNRPRTVTVAEKEVARWCNSLVDRVGFRPSTGEFGFYGWGKWPSTVAASRTQELLLVRRADTNGGKDRLSLIKSGVPLVIRDVATGIDDCRWAGLGQGFWAMQNISFSRRLVQVMRTSDLGEIGRFYATAAVAEVSGLRGSATP